MLRGGEKTGLAHVAAATKPAAKAASMKERQSSLLERIRAKEAATALAHETAPSKEEAYRGALLSKLPEIVDIMLALQSTARAGAASTVLAASTYVSLNNLTAKIRDSLRIPFSDREIKDAVRTLADVVPAWCKVSEAGHGSGHASRMVVVRLVPLAAADGGSGLGRDDILAAIAGARRPQ
ncbi:uncharacterized protein V1510DRAFT_418563 [Dipodascopsis tothii]|uniref:uncharacterized protein n=1 Tax=Dipodascopsis tothii TaxID=44089 RepID=UPI0034CF175B